MKPNQKYIETINDNIKILEKLKEEYENKNERLNRIIEIFRKQLKSVTE